MCGEIYVIFASSKYPDVERRSSQIYCAEEGGVCAHKPRSVAALLAMLHELALGRIQGAVIAVSVIDSGYLLATQRISVAKLTAVLREALSCNWRLRDLIGIAVDL